jgi:hypothetical protein
LIASLFSILKTANHILIIQQGITALKNLLQEWVVVAVVQVFECGVAREHWQAP